MGEAKEGFTLHQSLIRVSPKCQLRVGKVPISPFSGPIENLRSEKPLFSIFLTQNRKTDLGSGPPASIPGLGTPNIQTQTVLRSPRAEDRQEGPTAEQGQCV